MFNEKALTAFFKISPTPCLVVFPDAPKFTIIEANNAYLDATNSKREDLIGKGIFEAFPENKNNLKANSFKNLTASLRTVMVTKKSHKMAIQKYDIPIRGTSKFELKCWKAENIPLLTDEEELQLIVHAVVDVTEDVLSNKKIEESQHTNNKAVELLKQTERISKLGRWELDLKTRKIFWSDNYQVLLGYEAAESEMSLEKSFDVVYSADKERVRAYLNNALLEQKEYIIEFRFLTKNDIVINVISRAVFVYDQQGNLQKLIGVLQDVTDVKNAEAATIKAIKDSNERFEYVNKATFDAIWDWDLVTDSIYWGEGFEKIFGHQISDLGNGIAAWKDNIHPKDLQRIIASYYTVIKSRENNWKEAYCFKKGNGDFSFVINKGIIIRDANGRVIRIIGAMHDISKQKQEEERSKLLESVITNATDAVLITEAEPFDLPGPKILFVNKAFTKMTGYSAEEVIGKTPRLLQGPKTDPEELKKLSTALRRWEPHEVTLLNYKKNGDEFWLNMAISPVANNNEWFTHWIAIERDVTEKIKKEKELTEISQKLKDTVESIQDGFYTLDTNWNVSYWNAEAARISGKSQLEVIGKNFWDIYNGRISKVIYKTFQNVKEQNKATRLEVHSKSNNKWFELNVFPSSMGVTVYFKDITERKQIESMLKKMNRTLEAKVKELAISNEELEQFAYVASHDLQEPLRMITGFLTQIEKKYENILDEKGKKYIYFAVDGAKRMRQIILDLLEFSRIGKIENKLEDIDLNILIAEIILLFGNQIAEGKAKISYENMPTILTYAAPIKQVFQNLISNGLKYSKTNVSPIIIIKSIETLKAWKFIIQDNGIGIGAEYFDKIFIIFQRLHNKDDYSGTGIGLAITKKIVENLGGKIWVTSQEGIGSAFHFTIPKKQTKKS